MKKVKDTKTFNWNPTTGKMAQGVSTFNAMTKKFENVPAGSQLRYNPLATRFELAPPHSVQKYNISSKTFQNVKANETLQFNPNNRQFEFGVGRVWNPYTQKYETRRG
jgi:hypothetical protein